MKLFVWHDVLRDYSAGMAIALAENADQARGLLAAKGVFHNPQDLAREPQEHPVDEPFADYVYGGG